MAEPGFYRCKSCHKRWSRMEYKMQRNPPPQCSCGSTDQETDRAADSQYTREVYGPVVRILTDKS